MWFHENQRPYAICTALGWGLISTSMPSKGTDEDGSAASADYHRITATVYNFAQQVRHKEVTNPFAFKKMFELDFLGRQKSRKTNVTRRLKILTKVEGWHPSHQRPLLQTPPPRRAVGIHLSQLKRCFAKDPNTSKITSPLWTPWSEQVTPKGHLMRTHIMEYPAPWHESHVRLFGRIRRPLPEPTALAGTWPLIHCWVSCSTFTKNPLHLHVTLKGCFTKYRWMRNIATICISCGGTQATPPKTLQNTQWPCTSSVLDPQPLNKTTAEEHESDLGADAEFLLKTLKVHHLHKKRSKRERQIMFNENLT